MSSGISNQESTGKISPGFLEVDTSDSPSRNTIQNIALNNIPISGFNALSESPIATTDLSIHITPLPLEIISILKKGSSSKNSRSIAFEREIIQGTQVFERDDLECWDLFSLDCFHFPEITSEEEAEKRLAKYAIDPYVSPFIPEDAEMSPGKKLDATYETIKTSSTSNSLVWFCCLYLLKSLKESPELLDEMTVLLQDLPNSPELLLNDLELCKAALEQGTLGDFVRALLSLIPLEEMAKLRLEADSIDIVNNSFGKQITKWQVEDYTTHEKQMESLTEWLKKPKHTFKVLNLSGLTVERLPPQLLPYMQNVIKLELGTNYDNIPDSIFEIQFTKLIYLSLSRNNGFDENFSYNFLQTLNLMKDLREIDLSNSQIDVEEIPGIVNYCIEKKINLVLPMPQKERDLITLMNHLGLAMLERSQTANIRFLFGSSERLEGENQYYYKALIEHMRAPHNLAILNGLTELDLSNLCIGTLPEEICELSGITKVILNGLQMPLSKVPKMIENLLKLPNLKCVEFSDSSFAEGFRSFADQCDVKGIMFLSPSSNEEVSLLDFLEKIDFNAPEEYKDEADLLNQILVQRKALETIGFLDLSNMNIDALPISLISCLSNVRILTLQNIYQQRTKLSPSFNRLLQLPRLQSIDLSNNIISPPIFATLSYLVQNRKSQLKSVTIANCEFFQENFDAFVLVCNAANVELITEK